MDRLQDLLNLLGNFNKQFDEQVALGEMIPGPASPESEQLNGLQFGDALDQVDIEIEKSAELLSMLAKKAASVRKQFEKFGSDLIDEAELNLIKGASHRAIEVNRNLEQSINYLVELELILSEGD